MTTLTNLDISDFLDPDETNQVCLNEADSTVRHEESQHGLETNGSEGSNSQGDE